MIKKNPETITCDIGLTKNKDRRIFEKKKKKTPRKTYRFFPPFYKPTSHHQKSPQSFLLVLPHAPLTAAPVGKNLGGKKPKLYRVLLRGGVEGEGVTEEP